MVHQFRSLLIALNGSVSDGSLSIEDTGIRWDPKAKSEGSVVVSKLDMKQLLWSRGSAGYELTAQLRGGGQYRFQSLTEKDLSTIEAECSKLFGQQIKKIEFNSHGGNWGTVTVSDSTLSFENEKKPYFSLPLGEVSQSLLQGKNDVSLEFNKNLDATSHHVLSEIRFFIPSSTTIQVHGMGGAGADGSPVEVKGPEAFHDVVVDRSELRATSDVICSFDNIKFSVPRANYRIDVCRSFLRLYGKSQSHRIDYSAIQRMFCLTPHDEPGYPMFFVFVLSPPIRQGKSAYPILVAELDKAEEFTADSPLSLNMSQTDLDGQFADYRLQTAMQGLLWEVFTTVVKAFSGKKVIGRGTFEAASGYYAVECSYKSNHGYFFPLERSFMFLNKPPMIFSHKEVKSIRFERVETDGGSRSFDLTLVKDTAPTTFALTNIDKAFLDPLQDFFIGKQLMSERLVVNAGGERGGAAGGHRGEDDESGEDDEEDDEDFQSGSSGSDSDVDMDDDASGDEFVVGRGKGAQKKAPPKGRGKGKDSDSEDGGRPAAKSRKR